jgi:hypothetical protein
MVQRNLQYTTETMTITPASVASGGYRSSAAFDNSAAGKLYIDCLVGGAVVIGAVAADGTINIYAYGSYDGTNYTAGLDGADGTVTWGTTPATTGVDGFNDLIFLGVISVDTTDDNDLVEFGPFSIAEAFGGTVPQKWGIVYLNNTGTAFNATQTNAELQFTGIDETIV